METTITFQGRLPGNNGKGGLLRMHWSRKTKYRDAYQFLSKAQTKNIHKGPVKIILTRYSAGVGMDYDNLVSTGKLPIDGIVRAGIIKDDKDSIIQEREYRQVKCKIADQKTTITIIDL